MKDSISNITCGTIDTIGGVACNCNIWLFIAVGESIVIIILLLIIFKGRNKTKKQVDININKAHTEQPDMNSNILNIGKKLSGETQIIYDKLRKTCHPDRFPNDPEKIALATELISRVNQSKNKFSELEALKVEIEEQLNIKIN